MGQPHTGTRCSIHRNEANTPTKIATFPRDKAKKSPLQQHVVSYNPIDSILADKNSPGHLCVCAALILAAPEAWPGVYQYTSIHGTDIEHKRREDRLPMVTETSILL